jgi:hypothetical protein
MSSTTTRETPCEWIGSGEGCDHQAVQGRSYCEQHVWRVYQKGSGLRTRRKDIQRANAVWDTISMIDGIAAELEAEEG